MKHHLIQIDAAGLFVADVPQWDDGARDPVDGVQMMHDGLPVLDEQGEPVWEIPPQPAIPPNPVPPLHVNTPCPGGFRWPKWDGTQWVEGNTELPAPEVPDRVPMAKGRKAMLRRGITASKVISAINDSAMTDLQKAEALNDFEYEAYIERFSPLVQSLAPALGLTQADIDAMLIEAAAL